MMKLVLITIILTISLAIIVFCKKRRRELVFKKSLINRFRKKLKAKNRFRLKVKSTYSDALMAEPNRDIKMSIWDKENLLREKADIHRARLSKYGHSRLNGEMFFADLQGGVYKYTSEGKKKYI